jgi:hypothetical protein
MKMKLGAVRAQDKQLDFRLDDAEGHFDWTQRFTLVSDAISADCGYPSSVVLKDGRVLTVYYATRAQNEPEWGVHCGAVIYQPPQ